MNEPFKIPSFIKVGAVFENDKDKEGNLYVDDNGQPRPSYVLLIGTVKYRLFPTESENENAPVFDVCFDCKANTYKKKEQD